MPLARGTRLGPYEINGPLGAGGMGEVYRATDTRLNRDVAIKVSSEKFSDRFAREASTVAALNHPHICTLHDVGPDYLVMELVEGQPLEGPLPVPEALRIADQILAALDHAHRRGVIHRDLKPANILSTRSGIKLLDFGLAKVREVVSADGVTMARALTSEGSLLGTLHYMSPEQLEGKAADERSDIFSFGCVLYELITGGRPFDASTPAGLIAAILDSKPAPIAPAALNRVLETCFAKNPDERWQSANELRHALRWVANPVEPSAAGARQRSWVPWLIAACTTVVAAVAGAMWPRPVTSNDSMLAFIVDAPPDTAFNFLVTGSAISPDGRFLVFRAGGANLAPGLWIRPIDAIDARRLPGTEEADFPFWAPDSRTIAFFAGNRLKTLDLAGGTPVVVAEAVGGSATWGSGGAWNRDGVILFGETRGLIRIAASGGTPEVLIAADRSRQERGVSFPQFLPDGRHFLYLLVGDNPEVEGVYSASLDDPSSRVRILQTRTKAIYAPPLQPAPEHLLFVRDQSLVAQRFDSAARRLEGDPLVITNEIATHSGLHAGAFWSSDTGVLVYRSGLALERTKLSWINRAGTRLGAAAPDDTYSTFRLAPDGKRLAFGRLEPGGPDDIWVMEFESERTTRFTFDPQIDTCPAWSRDGRQIAFSSDRSGVRQIYRKAAGGGPDQQLTEGPEPKCAMDWSADGGQLLYAESGNSVDLWLRHLDGDRKPVPVTQTPFDEVDGRFSPDGKWIAYTSNESGRNEVYVMPNQDSGAASRTRWPVSNQGGRSPRWRGDGRELFYLAADNRTIMATDIRSSNAGLEPGTPRSLFSASTPQPSGDIRAPYDVTSDGQRFLIQEPTQLEASPLSVLINWQARLRTTGRP